MDNQSKVIVSTSLSSRYQMQSIDDYNKYQKLISTKMPFLNSFNQTNKTERQRNQFDSFSQTQNFPKANTNLRYAQRNNSLPQLSIAKNAFQNYNSQQYQVAPISRDNQIVFINHGSQIRCPSERKTPPPPKWGEEDNPGYDPTEPFYDRNRDPVFIKKVNMIGRQENEHTKKNNIDQQTKSMLPLIKKPLTQEIQLKYLPPVVQSQSIIEDSQQILKKFQLTDEFKQKIALRKDFLMNGQLNLNAIIEKPQQRDKSNNPTPRDANCKSKEPLRRSFISQVKQNNNKNREKDKQIKQIRSGAFQKIEK
eukprot:403348868